MATRRSTPRTRTAKVKTPGVYFWGPDQMAAADVFNNLFATGLAMDTETTGLDEMAEITEIAVVRISSGEVLLNTRIRPKGRIHPDAARVSGITDADLVDCPRWLDIEAQFLDVSTKGRFVAWSGERVGDQPFDRRMLDQTRQIAGLPAMTPVDFPVANIKQLHRQFRNEAYGNMLHSDIRSGLARAAAIEQLQFTGREHSALADAEMVAAVVRACAAADAIHNFREIMRDGGTD